MATHENLGKLPGMKMMGLVPRGGRIDEVGVDQAKSGDFPTLYMYDVKLSSDEGTLGSMEKMTPMEFLEPMLTMKHKREKKCQG